MKKVAHVLLIDDDNTTNFFNKIVIKKADVCDNVHSVLTAQDAIEYLQTRFEEGQPLPDVIFLDINMPEMNGWEFMEVYTGLDIPKDNISIYMLSSSQNDEDVQLARSHPLITDFLKKPLNASQLTDDLVLV